MTFSTELAVWIPFTSVGFITALLLLRILLKGFSAADKRTTDPDVWRESRNLLNGAILDTLSSGLFFFVGVFAVFQAPPTDRPANVMPVAMLLTWVLIVAAALLDCRIALAYVYTQRLLTKNRQCKQRLKVQATK